jgi:hypothetical protein
MTKRIAVFWLLDFVSVTAIAVVLSTAKAATKWWVAIPVAVIILSKIAEYIQYEHAAINVVRYQLQVLLTLLPADGSRIRCTYHRPSYRWLRNRMELVQAFDYIPTGGGGGRYFSVGKGIIGKVYSIKAPRVENFASDEEYRRRMVAEYNYTVADVMERTADRRSYLCYPILDENHAVLGLLYLDSDKPTLSFRMRQTSDGEPFAKRETSFGAMFLLILSVLSHRHQVVRRRGRMSHGRQVIGATSSRMK